MTQILPIPRNRTKPCTHRHYSGRRCAARIKIGGDFCRPHQRFDATGQTACDECAAMLKAFPIRKEMEADGLV